jgi:hypothetical protein
LSPLRLSPAKWTRPPGFSPFTVFRILMRDGYLEIRFRVLLLPASFLLFQERTTFMVFLTFPVVPANYWSQKTLDYFFLLRIRPASLPPVLSLGFIAFPCRSFAWTVNQVTDPKR